MRHRDIVAIGASAGGVEALQHLLSKLAPGFEAAVLVTMHLAEDYASRLDRVLERSGSLPVRFAADGETLENGQVYLAPPQRHLLLTGERRVQLGQGPRENNARPAIDPMFRSVALCCGSRAIGIVLSGMLDDGAAGLLALKQCGGATVVQEPSDAAFADMPAHALRRAQPDHVATLKALPALVQELVRQPAEKPVSAAGRLRLEVEIAKGRRVDMSEMDGIGRRSVLACPECHGVMWEIDDGQLVRYRCHVGHAYTADTMRYAIDENLAQALASALRALDERVAIAEKLRDKAVQDQHNRSVELWQRRVAETQRDAEIIREAILRMEQVSEKTAE